MHLFSFKNSLFSFFLISLIYSCEIKESKRIPTESKLSYETNSLYLPLDEETSAINGFYHLIESDSNQYVSFFNSLNSTIYTYDLHTQSILSKIKFDKEGPNGVGSRIWSAYIRPDSTIDIHSFYKRALLKFNLSGQIIKEIKLSNESFDVYPISSMKAPIVDLGKKLLYYSGKTSLEENLKDLPIILVYNLEKDTILDTGIRLNEFYESSDEEYYPGDLSEPSMTQNTELNTIIISYPLADSVIIYDSDGQISKKYFGHSSIERKEKIDKSKAHSGPLEQVKSMLQYDRYGSIHYDPHNQIYLRRFNYATPERFLEKDILKSESTFLVADKDFNILGELDINGSEKLLVSKKGLIQFQFMSTNEDSLEVKFYSYEF